MERTTSSLHDLSDIVVPDPVPLWPLGQGSYLLLLAILILAGILVYLLRERYRRNQYRRDGLTLLSRAVTVYEVSVILKRVALVVFPRSQVAPLYGNEWVDFLQDTCPGCTIEELGGGSENEAGKVLKDGARFWIRNHRPTGKG